MSDRTPSNYAPWTMAAWALLLAGCIGGLGLAAHFVPTPELAYRSVQVLWDEVAGGALAHGLHRWIGTVAMVLLLLHLAWGLWSGSYRQGGRVLWWCNLGLLVLVTAFDATGQLLLWNEQGVLAAEVRAGIVRGAPGLGVTMGEVLTGDATVGTEPGPRTMGLGGPAMTRAHTLHLAGLPLLLVLLGLPLLRTRIAPRAAALVASLAACAAVLLAWTESGLDTVAALGLPFAPGDTTGFSPVPEWYLLWLNTIAAHGPSWAPTVLPGMLLGGLGLLPILDPAGAKRTPVRILGGALGLLVVGLSAPPLLAEHQPRAAVLDPPSVQDEALFAGYLSLRNQRCLDCHQVTVSGVTYGKQQHDAEPIRVWGADDPEFPALLVDILESPGMALGVLEMPPYDHMPMAERHDLAAYLEHLVSLPKDAQEAAVTPTKDR